MTTRPLNFVSATNPLLTRPLRRHGDITPLSRRTLLVASHTLNGRTIPGPMQPTSHNILIKVGAATDVTAGGIILPDDAQEKPTFGEAVEVGPGKILGNGVKIPMHIGKGDAVMYGRYGGTDVSYDGEKHTVVNQDDVLCKFNSAEFTIAACEPVFDRVVVKTLEKQEETTGGLIISDNAKEKQTCGEIVAMGPGRFMENGEMEPTTMALGDIVYYGGYAGTEVTLEEEEYVVLRMADVFAKA